MQPSVTHSNGARSRKTRPLRTRLISQCRLLLCGITWIALCSLVICGCKFSANPSVPARQASTIEIESPIGIEMLIVPGGQFQMGGDADDCQPVHAVNIPAFAIDKYEMQQQFLTQLEISDPSPKKGDDLPVAMVRWSDAAEICNARSRAEGLEPCYDELTFDCNFDATGYRLPTEAEWEYAARAGTTSSFHFGEDENRLNSYAVYGAKSAEPVGSLRPNEFGIYDMLGNVSEWCQDRYDSDYYSHSPTGNPRGPDVGKQRVIRGGTFKSDAAGCRVFLRKKDVPGYDDACFAKDTYGFRCVRRLTEKEQGELSAAMSGAPGGTASAQAPSSR